MNSSIEYLHCILYGVNDQNLITTKKSRIVSHLLHALHSPHSLHTTPTLHTLHITPTLHALHTLHTLHKPHTLQTLDNYRSLHMLWLSLLSTIDWDLGVCLQQECRRKDMALPEPLRSWVDLKAIYKVQQSRLMYRTAY